MECLPVVGVDTFAVQEENPQTPWAAIWCRYLLPVAGRELVDEQGVLGPGKRVGPVEPDPPAANRRGAQATGMSPISWLSRGVAFTVLDHDGGRNC